jgi:hypothetical protein
LYFGSKNPHVTYKFNDFIIKAENDVKDLGVYINSNLKSTFHCNKLVDKTKRLCAMIFRCLKSRDPNCLLKA